ncbi:VRR-NUC domain-containing protein [Bacteroides clarus]|uniref:VRR-NUC domain-containing protein n=1 Tax=Bacteroides clarus TaxID=626929 RepID=UPI00210132D7|nr:VRR-NUC domain-containing protein [Bacteroides clarus]MCQ1546755.1 VRR-NUC domain-containing protein [Bacteroides clarus]
MKKKQTAPQSESQIQHSCLTWFRLQYPSLSFMLFAVPNGELRNIVVATKLKRQGVLRGVSDLILLVPKKGFASLCIEMKTPKGRQSEEQIKWQREAEKYRNKYVVCHSLPEFMNEVNSYLR